MPGQESPAPNSPGLEKFSIIAPHPLFSPFARTSLPYSTLTRVPGRPLSYWRWEEVAGEPRLLSGGLRPSMASFLLGPAPWSPICLPLCRVPRDSRPRASIPSLGNVPLAYLLSNNPGALEPLTLSHLTCFSDFSLGSDSHPGVGSLAGDS